MRVADLIAKLLVEAGVEHCFMLTGGGAMHLNDAFGREHGLKKVFTHHEQAAAIAAESYARLCGKPALVNVTTGPGGVNALNGVYGAYVDSIPMIVVSGQVKRETYAPNYDTSLRQLGDQEIDIVRMAGGITKYAVLLQDPADTRKVVEKALYLAARGRPGPVWIDVPIDVQGSMVDPAALDGFDPADAAGEHPNTVRETGALNGAALAAEIAAILAEIAAAERPLILVGSGPRLADRHSEFLAFAEALNIPVVTGWNAHDAIPNGHPLYVGRPGTVGDRAGNFAVQSADYVLVLGSRLNIRQVSYNWSAFAADARVTMVDIDAAELAKPTLSLHRTVHADLRDFFDHAQPAASLHHAPWLNWCRERARRWPVVSDAQRSRTGAINPYVFGEALFDALEEGDIVVTGDGTACVTTFQCADLKAGQRLYTNSGCASMGYDLPAAIGAWHASGAKRIICLAGDGSIMMNLQELQTIAGCGLPIKLFVLNNDGYHSIRQTQQNYFADNITGCGPDSGLTFPDFVKLGTAFGLKTSRVATHADLSAAIHAAISGDGPTLCEVVIDKRQEFAPKLASRRLPDGTMVSPSLEDMAPFLPREELAQAMSPVMELTGLGAARLKASGDRIVVTGATGWLGSATLDLLYRTLGRTAFNRRVRTFDSRNLAQLAALSCEPTLVFHNAFLGRERASEPGYVAANEAIRETVLAALDPIGATAIFVPSSGAVYGGDYYGACKRADEAAFAAWSGHSVIARIFNLSGPGINKRGSYALASFIADRLAGRSIQIRADRPVLRSYLAIRELMSVVAGMMTDGSGSVPFDAAGREVVEMADIAAAVGGPVVRPAVTGASDRYLGDNAAYEIYRVAQHVAPIDFATQVRETADWLAAQRIAA